MDRSKFRNDVHKYIDVLLDEYSFYQDLLKDTFKEVHRICMKHKIPYYLGWGSLLGLVRDNDDIIPWDSDYDINVPYEYIPKLIKALDTDLSPDYYFVSNFNKRNYNYYQIRVTKKGVDSNISHVDIFYMISVPDHVDGQVKFQKMAQSLVRKKQLLVMKFSFSEVKKQLGLARAIYRMCYHCYFRLFNSCFLLNKKFEKLTSYPCEKSNHVLILVGDSPVFEKNIFSKGLLVQMNYSQVIVPEKSELFLTKIYGDFLKYPPIESRFNQFYNGITNIKKTQNKSIKTNREDSL